ncbi:MAG: alpha/beta fold hydrolase [Solirubrobacteraceae bacterium]
MLAGADTRTVARDDVALSVVCAGERDRPTIVFVHGYPDTKSVWDPVLERLAADFHVVAYDVRGAGQSSAPRGPAAYSFEHLAGDFEAVCEAVAPGAAVHLVGHDWGGIQGWEFATSARFGARLASFTSIAGPALHHAVMATREPLRRGRLLTWLGHVRRSWYIAPLCLPGGPTLAWRGVLSAGRWRQTLMTLEGLEVDADYPAATVVADGLHGANLYRRNILPLLWRRPSLVSAHAPVQLIVPDGDRFISDSYYEAAEQVAPGLRRRTVPGSHWAQRSRPELVAGWIAEFVAEKDSSGG